MKDSKKKDILSGAAGMAAGAAGTIGAQELRDYLNEQEETPIEEIDDTAQVTDHLVDENQQESHPQQPIPVSHQDVDEIQPVASVTETIEIDASEEIQELMDVDPDEIAEAIIEEAEDPEEVLLAMNDERDDEEGDDEEDDVECDDEDDGEIEDDIDDDLPDIEESIS